MISLELCGITLAFRKIKSRKITHGKGTMRLYLRKKGKLPCFSYLVRGKSFSFYRGKIR